jgi:hypothetical protein
MNEFKGPDVKAPRFRQKVVRVTDKDFFDRLRKKHAKCKELNNASILSIIKKFNESLYETVIDNRDGVELPEGLGTIFIATCKNAKSKNIDFGKSKKYGVAVTNNNWETDGKLAKIFYTSYASKYKFTFRECWGFVACRNFKRSVAKNYPENWTMYVEVSPDRKLRSIYTTNVLKHIRKKKLDVDLTNYNEFDL